MDHEFQGIVVKIKELRIDNMHNTIKYRGLVLLLAVMSFSGCKKLYDLPDEKDYLSPRADYRTKVFDWRLGRTRVHQGVFDPDGSNFPMTFEIRNPRFGDGRDASDMFALQPTLVWTGEYSGEEKSLAEIEAKRKIENRPMLEIRGNGDILMWNTATRNIITPLDSSQNRLSQDYRLFDVKITNSGGSKIIKDLRVDPVIEIPYWPDEDYNNITGKPRTINVNSRELAYNTASLSNVRGPDNQFIANNTNEPSRGLMRVYIRRFTNDLNGNRLRIKILNKDSVAIDPIFFNETKWLEQVHGFNEAGTALGFVRTPEHIEYRVAYPIPLARIPSRYTTGGKSGSGEFAQIDLMYSRVGFGGRRETGRIFRDFKIYEKGDWEIVFHFKFVNPRFEND